MTAARDHPPRAIDVREVIAAIENKGRAPAHHQMIMARHRREWPTLWAALDALQDNYHGRERS